MLAQNQANADALQSLKRELNGLGYVGNLLQENYEFADILSENVRVSQIPLAAFAQDPPSYRNAAFGVAIANGTSGIELVRNHRALGGPANLRNRQRQCTALESEWRGPTDLSGRGAR